MGLGIKMLSFVYGNSRMVFYCWEWALFPLLRSETVLFGFSIYPRMIARLDCWRMKMCHNRAGWAWRIVIIVFIVFDYWKKSSLSLQRTFWWEFEDGNELLRKLEVISPNDQVADSMWWKFLKDGKLMGIWEALKRTGHEEQFGRQLHPGEPPVSLGSLLAKLVLCSRCFLRESANELVNHLPLHCTFTRQIWTMFRAIFDALNLH